MNKALTIALISILCHLPALGKGPVRGNPPPSISRNTSHPGAKSASPKAINAKGEACDAALKACQDLVTAQDLSIVHLKDNVRTLQTALSESKAREPIMPTWMLITTSLLAGTVTGLLLAK